MKITEIDAVVLANPDLDALACDSAQDTVLVRVHTDEGLVGTGEVDATPYVVEAFIKAPPGHSFSLSIRDLLIGEDPRDIRRLWHKLYYGTIMAGRRGMGIHVIGAIDVALWDIRGKAEGQPIWKLLGGALRDHVTPYASVLPGGKPGAEALADAVRRMEEVRGLGYRAAKIETVVEVCETDRDVIAMVEGCRTALGPDITLMVDVAYRWRDAKTALDVLRELEDLDVYFVETPLLIDDIRGCAKVAANSPIRVAYGELNAHRAEFVELMDVGGVDVVQPDPPRAGGITESIRIAEAAEDRGCLVVPHAWKTGITAASAIHLSAASPNCPMIEYLPPQLEGPGLRRDLLSREPAFVDGLIELPGDPGLGIELDEDAVETFQLDRLVVA